MIRSFGDFSNDEIEKICNCFEENYDFDAVKNQFNLEHNILWSILYSQGKYLDNIYDFLCQENILDDKIIVAGDTHYCSIYEEMLYTYMMFEYVAINDIHTILLVGDIIESWPNYRSCYKSGVKQASYFINNYPCDKNVKTIGIYGNHDYNAIKKDVHVRNILESRDDINILGFKKCYLNWLGNVISIQHKIKQFKLNLPLNAECLSYKGHSHYYHIKENRNRSEYIFAPSLSNDVNNLSIGISKKNFPGFLESEIVDGRIITSNYGIKNKNLIKEDEYVLKLIR